MEKSAGFAPACKSMDSSALPSGATAINFDPGTLRRISAHVCVTAGWTLAALLNDPKVTPDPVLAGSGHTSGAVAGGSKQNAHSKRINSSE